MSTTTPDTPANVTATPDSDTADQRGEIVRMTRDAGILGAFIVTVRWPALGGTTDHRFHHSLPLDASQYDFETDPTVPTPIDSKRGGAYLRVTGPISEAIRTSDEVAHWRYWYEHLRENLQIAREHCGLGYETLVFSTKKIAARDANWLWTNISPRDIWLFELRKATITLPGSTPFTSTSRSTTGPEFPSPAPEDRLLEWSKPLAEALGIEQQFLFRSREDLEGHLRSRR